MGTEINFARRPVLWGVVRSENTTIYSKLLQLLKDAVESYGSAECQFSCAIMDNSDAEIAGLRCVMTVSASILSLQWL